MGAALHGALTPMDGPLTVPLPAHAGATGEGDPTHDGITEEGPGGAVGGICTLPITHKQATEHFLGLVAAPIEPAVLQAPKAPRGRPRRPARPPATATRRSYCLNCKKNLFPAARGNIMT